jgi:NAD(P)-dependent dehydrogenase (short-subunit alcohol dehydrogenase family)
MAIVLINGGQSLNQIEFEPPSERRRVNGGIMEGSMSHLAGKVAVITGGSSGIGLATAKRFAREGAYVFITGRRASELEKAKAEIGKNVTTVQGDVANLADLDRLYGTVKTEKGVVDIVVANAGFVEHAQIFDLSEVHYDKTMDINVKGVVFTVQKALPLMTRGGSIVVVSSIVNVKGIPAHGTYTASKAGVRALVRVWAQELKDKGIRVNSLSPGATETPIIRGQFSSDEASDAAKSVFASMTPLGRLGAPDELAAGAYYLASDESSYVTGIDLPVDGGLAQV